MELNSTARVSKENVNANILRTRTHTVRMYVHATAVSDTSAHVPLLCRLTIGPTGTGVLGVLTVGRKG